jgi:hypothetical protein
LAFFCCSLLLLSRFPLSAMVHHPYLKWSFAVYGILHAIRAS